MNKLIISLGCLVAAIGVFFITTMVTSSMIATLHSGPSSDPDLTSARWEGGIGVGIAAILLGVGGWQFIAFIAWLPRSRRPLVCLLAAAPMACIAFVLSMLIGPGDMPGGGFITFKLMSSVVIGGAAGLAMIVWASVAVGPERRPPLE